MVRRAADTGACVATSVGAGVEAPSASLLPDRFHDAKYNYNAYYDNAGYYGDHRPIRFRIRCVRIGGCLPCFLCHDSSPVIVAPEWDGFASCEPMFAIYFAID